MLGPFWAISGIEAFEICQKHKEIDIVLMDMKLPELSGYEAVKRIKKIKVKLPIIAQTAYAMEEDRTPNVFRLAVMIILLNQ